MSQGVSTKIAIATEHFTARTALIGLVVRVRKQMSFQVASLIKAPSANWTLVGRLLHVKYLVDCEGSTLAETLATLAALERLLFAMNVPAATKRSINDSMDL